MQIQIWGPSGPGQRNRYAWDTILGVTGIVSLAVLLTVGSSVLSIYLGESGKVFSFFSMILVTAFILFLTAKFSQRSLRDAVIFFQNEEGRLFVTDVRQFVQYRRGILGFFQTSVEIQKAAEQVQRQAERSNRIPADADEILKVLGIKERQNSYSVICWMRYAGGRMGKRTQIIPKGYIDEEGLLMQLQRAQKWETAMELKENRALFYSLASLIVCMTFVVLCTLSHPYIGRLSQGVYYPCMGLAYIAFISTFYFAVKYRRGE